MDRTTHLLLFGIGSVRLFLHRPIVGKVKRLTVKHEAGEWYAIFITSREAPDKRPFNSIPKERIRGADLGLRKFAVFDNEKDLEFPAYYKRSEEEIKRLQRNLAHKKAGSKRWRRTNLLLARLHLHIRRQREDWQDKRISEIYSGNDILILEKLNVSGMLKNHNLAKSISDVAFGSFARKCLFKAATLGKHLVMVDPWGTTQFCHNCLTWVPKDLKEKQHVCPKCGINILRDLNSSRLIKWLGIQSSPPSDGGSSLAKPKPLPSLRGLASRGDEAGSHLS